MFLPTRLASAIVAARLWAHDGARSEHDNVKGVIRKFQFPLPKTRVPNLALDANRIDPRSQTSMPTHEQPQSLCRLAKKRTGTATDLKHTLSGQVLTDKALIPGAYLLAQPRDLAVDGEHFVQGTLRVGDRLELPRIELRIAVNNSI